MLFIQIYKLLSIQVLTPLTLSTLTKKEVSVGSFYVLY